MKKSKEYSPFLAKITVLKEVRGLPKGLTISFDKPVMALVGDNGTGKSTILDGIRSSFGIKDSSYLKQDLKDSFDIMRAKCIYKALYYDFHADDAKFSGVFKDDISSQIGAMRASSGLASLGQFVRTGIPDSKGNLILLDEPCRGLSIKTQLKFLNLFHRLLMNGNQIVMTTHSKIFMDWAEKAGQVYSVEHKKEMTVKELELAWILSVAGLDKDKE